MDSEIFETFDDFNKNYDTLKKNYKTANVLTKYEKTKILSERCQQLNNGSISYLKDFHSDDIYEIAFEELKQKLIPFIIKRPLSNTFEYWKLEDLEIL